MSERYVIGIDLGTTNSSLAYIDLSQTGESQPTLLPLTQWENDEQSIDDVRLPSFLWLLPKNILKKGLKPHPAFPSYQTPFVIGRLAREKALTEPLQVVHSAKSWTSSGTLDHRISSILPWGSSLDKLSPVEAQSAYLAHIRHVWNARFPASPLEEQKIIITVPASFDEVAQRLTLEAAKDAGYPARIELLEEPSAAYYEWEALHQREDGHILVCDVGGGTSDFTLLSREAAQAKRIKVSDHILLGGDNIDLSLAHRLSLILSPEELPRAAWNLLLAQTRKLKEDALGNEEDETFHISIPLDPKNLFGRYLSAEVLARDLRNWVLEDFFPQVSSEARPQRATGLQAWGLPYAKDTAVTRHLAEFLDGSSVDAILCVGGTLLPPLIQKRILETVQSWQNKAVKLLSVDATDLAVALGAARFGALRARSQNTVHAPYPRDLLLDVEDKKGIKEVLLIPKGHPRMQAYEVELEGLHLRLGEEVRFQLHARAEGGRQTALPPLVLRLGPSERGKGNKALIPVRLEASVRETGVLEVVCLAREGESKGRWILDFAVETAKARSSEQTGLPLSPLPRLDEAKRLIASYYARQSAHRIDGLTPALEELFQLPRDQWTADHLRGLWPALEAVMFNRNLTPEHEAVWFYLAGFCLRPGFGYRGDEERMSSLLRIYDESFRRVDATSRLQTHWWILWRRLAGGLDAKFQQKLWDRYIPTLRKEKDISPELIRLLGSLERLDRVSKEQLGRLLLNQLKEGQKNHIETKIWALARLVSRYLIYAGSAYVISPALVEEWADELMALPLPAKVRLGVFYAWGGRLRGDKQYDIDPAYRAKFLEKIDYPEGRRGLTELVAVDSETQAQMLADSLPSGFVFTN